jgi:acetyl-CoA carboxylase carboxyl transferase subunit alpha
LATRRARHQGKNLPQFRHAASGRLSQGPAPDEAGREIRYAGDDFRRYAGRLPGIDAEERGQSEAIGRNLYVMAELKVPVIVTIIGEGGSGGALAIAVGDTVQMLQYSTYSVISPEGCASILWKSAEKAPEAAETMGITAQRLKTLGLIDKIVSEPLGGAHRDHAAMAQNLKKALQEALKQLSGLPTAELLATRYERLMSYGRFKEQAVK